MTGIAAMSSNVIRFVPSILALVLAACQPNSAPAPEAASAETSVTPEHVASLPAEQSRSAVNQLANEVVAAETSACQENPDFGACVSVRMLKAFDRYGFLASHCREQTDLKAVRNCVQFGRAGIDWLLAIDRNPDIDFDWSKPEQSQDLALKKLNDTLTERCKGKPEQPGNSCFTSLSARLLGLSDVVAARCGLRAELEQRGACIIDAHNAGMYGAALASLSR